MKKGIKKTMNRIPEQHGNLLAGRNGQRFGISEYGDPQGKPLLYFHGCPGSRLEGGLTHETAAALGLRIICIDRPGYGLTPMDHDRTLTDWPKDIETLTTSLGVERFGILGVSGGGPYAMACAAALPERVATLGLVCSMAPMDCCSGTREMWPLLRMVFWMAKRAPKTARLLMRLSCRMVLVSPGGALALLTVFAPAPDDRVLADREVREVLSRSLREALRQSADGAALDLDVFLNPWNVPLGSIRVPVLLWHGERDVTVPVAMGRYLARSIPGCRAFYYPEEGHVSLAVRRMGEILKRIGEALSEGGGERMQRTDSV